MNYIKNQEDLFVDTKTIDGKTYYCIKQEYIKYFFCNIDEPFFTKFNPDDYELTYNKKAPDNIEFFSYNAGVMESSKMKDKNCGRVFRSGIQEWTQKAEYIYVLEDGLNKLFNYFTSSPETPPSGCIGSLCKRIFTPRINPAGGKRTRKQKKTRKHKKAHRKMIHKKK